ncbi:UNVERIFIED_CONTAM: hypothetical protein DV031_16595, partial [Lacticaseibacillus paracasei]
YGKPPGRTVRAHSRSVKLDTFLKGNRSTQNNYKGNLPAGNKHFMPVGQYKPPENNGVVKIKLGSIV